MDPVTICDNCDTVMRAYKMHSKCHHRICADCITSSADGGESCLVCNRPSYRAGSAADESPEEQNWSTGEDTTDTTFILLNICAGIILLAGMIYLIT